MSRAKEMVALIPKSLTATRVLKRQQRLHEIEYQMTLRCDYCGGLPHDLPPHCYDTAKECECDLSRYG